MHEPCFYHLPKPASPRQFKSNQLEKFHFPSFKTTAFHRDRRSFSFGLKQRQIRERFRVEGCESPKLRRSGIRFPPASSPLCFPSLSMEPRPYQKFQPTRTIEPSCTKFLHHISTRGIVVFFFSLFRDKNYWIKDLRRMYINVY